MKDSNSAYYKDRLVLHRWGSVCIKARELFNQDVVIPEVSFEMEKLQEEELIKFLLEFHIFTDIKFFI